jgi:hypothetical protein
MTMKLVGAADGDAMLFLHGSRAPTSAEWDEVMAVLGGTITAGTFPKLRALVVTDGGGPDVVMRGELQALCKQRGHAPKTAVVAIGIVVRGMVTAVSWFNPNIKAFAPNQFTGALEYLGLSRAAQRLLRELSDMERGLGPNSCLSLIRDSSVSARA